MAFDIPHFSLPFRFENGTPALVEQDSFDHIADCVEAAARTIQGTRTEAPTFGIPDYLMAVGGSDLDELRQALLESEPRITPIVSRLVDITDLRADKLRILLEEEA